MQLVIASYRCKVHGCCVYLQVAQKVERQGQEEIKAKAEAVAGAFEGGARTRSRAGRAGGSGSTSAWNPTKRELAVMLDKDPDKYDDWLAIQVCQSGREGLSKGCGFTELSRVCSCPSRGWRALIEAPVAYAAAAL